MSYLSATLGLALLQCCTFGFSLAFEEPATMDQLLRSFQRNFEEKRIHEEDLKSERELRRDIFEGYDKLVRPVRKYSTSVSVQVELALLGIRELNEESQVLTLDSWILMMWNDEYLRWQPSDYDGIDVLRIPHTEVWKPDVTLYTSLTDAPMMPAAPAQVLIYSNGSVLWVPPFTLRNRCFLPFSKVPKDKVECNVRFGSWTYSADQMDILLRNEKADLSDFVDNNIHWKLEKVVAGRQDKYYPCCTESYPSIDYNITLARRWSSGRGNSLLDNTGLFD